MARPVTVLLITCILAPAAYINVLGASTSGTISVTNATASPTEPPQSPTTTPKVTTIQKVTTTPKVTTTQKVTTTPKVTTTQKVTTTPKSDCLIFSTNETLIQIIKNDISSGTKLIQFTMSVDGSELHCRNKEANTMYKPLTWVRSTSRHGDGLLMLRPEFDVLSLFTLSIGVTTVTVPLTSHPQRCVDNLTYTDMEAKLRNLVMNNFENATVGSTTLGATESVCNQHIIDSDGTASFKYYCCRLDGTKEIKCEYMKKDDWVEVLLIIITILKIGVALFVPKLVPETLYRKKYTAEPYSHTLERPLTLSTVVTKSPKQFTNVKNVVKLSNLKSMTTFRDTVCDLEDDTPTELKLKRLNFNIKSQRLQSTDYAPVGIFITFVNSIFRCGIRKRSSVKDCCDARICIKVCGHQGITWYQVMREFMKLMMLIAIAFPWLVRVYVYYKHEAIDTELRKEVAEEKNLKFAFTGNFTLFLSPIHIIFIVIYGILVVESFIYGVIGKKAQDRLKLVVRKCLRDMQEIRKMAVLGWFVRLCLKPFVLYGVLGLFIGVATWIIFIPIMLLVAMFYILPTFNVTVRLLAHFAVYILPRNVCTSNGLFRKFSKFSTTLERKLEMEEISTMEKLEKDEETLNSCWKRLQQIVVIILCLISLYSIIFLVTELVAFVVELCIYTMMGLIVNANTTMTYVSLFLLLWVYGHDVFGSVRNKFLTFNTALIGAIASLGNDKTSEIIYMHASKQGNNAFIVQTDRNNALDRPAELVTGSKGHLRWKVSRMLLFLSRRDETFIPTTFYFEACNMEFFGVPGELLICYLKAFLEFGSIIIFLIFVLIVALAFGDTYELSATNRTLATIAGGFVPFILRKFLFKSHPTPPIDTSSVAFQVCLDEAIENFEQSWAVEDIFVESKQPLNATAVSKKPTDNEEVAVIEVNETDNATTSNDGPTENVAADLPSGSSSCFSGTEKKASAEIDLLIIRPEYENSSFDAMGDINTSKDNIHMNQV